MSKRKSVIASLLIVTLLGIPQASQTLTQSMSLPGVNESLEESEDKPVEITSSRGPESFNQTISTSHEKTVKRVMTNKSVTVHESPEYRIKIEKKPGVKKKVVKASEGVLTILNSSEMDKMEIEGPEGTFTKKTVGGKVKTSFQGLNAEKLKERRSELMDSLEENTDSLPSESSKAEDRFKIFVQPESEGKGEYVKINNTGELVNLEGWSIQDGCRRHGLCGE